MLAHSLYHLILLIDGNDPSYALTIESTRLKRSDDVFQTRVEQTLIYEGKLLFQTRTICKIRSRYSPLCLLEFL